MHPVFLNSCTQVRRFKPTSPVFGTKEEWQRLCSAAKKVEKGDVKSFYELNFKVYQVGSHKPWWKFWQKEKSLFTGYYQPQLSASFERDETYTTPLYGLPENLITANLGVFDETLKGKTLVGQVVGKRFVPYATRAQINQNPKAYPIAWLKNDIDAFFLHIQGSGQLVLPSGQTVQVAYAGNNGHAYTAIGKTMKEKGIFKEGEEITMQSIKAWLEENPEKRDEIYQTNARYIFFKLADVGPKGAQGVVLTQNRSMAIDTRYIPLGTPMFVQTQTTSGAFNKAMVAQDVGAAITGPIRGDIFFGKGHQAEQQAGAQNAPGQLFVMVPNL